MAYRGIVWINATTTATMIVDSALNNSNSSLTMSEEDIFDTSLYPYPVPIRSLPLWEVCVKVILYVLIILLALVGNTLVVYVVWSIKKMRTATNFYIVNLAISDLMVTTSCSWVHLVDALTEGWVLGAFFCKFNSFAQVLSLVSSILTLTLISCDRFFGIVFAMKARMTDRRSTVFIISIWVCAVGISSPILFYREHFTRPWLDHVEMWCDDTWRAPSRTIYYTVISVVLYFLPILVMTIAYSFIIWRLWSSKMPGERIESEVKNQDKTKKKVVIMLIVILCVFAVCWLPFQIVVLYAEYRTDSSTQLPLWFRKFSYFANYLAFANSAFNPIIYTGFNLNFRRAFKSIFWCGRKRKGHAYNAIYGGNRHQSQSTVVTQYHPNHSGMGHFQTTVVTKI